MDYYLISSFHNVSNLLTFHDDVKFQRCFGNWFALKRTAFFNQQVRKLSKRSREVANDSERYLCNYVISRNPTNVWANLICYFLLPFKVIQLKISIGSMGRSRQRYFYKYPWLKPDAKIGRKKQVEGKRGKGGWPKIISPTVFVPP